MNSLNKIHELGYRTDIGHHRFYRDYADTNECIDDYFSTPRKVNMSDMHHLALSKPEAQNNMLDPKDILSRGGITFLMVYNDEGIVVERCSVCSFTDNYNKRIGIEIAAARALQDLQERKVISNGQLA